jgi:ribosomal protein S18 acetylase RimI-like enzyme
VDVPIRLEELAPEHRDRLAELVRATGAFSSDELAVALELFDSSLRTPADYAFLGAFTPEGELVGYACYGPTPATDRTYDLYWIVVDPARQSTGIGTLLLAEVERRLSGHRARMLVVETSSRSEYLHTRGFYGRRGYTERARVRDFYAPGDDRIIFTKRFPDSPTGRGAQSP